MAEEAEKHEGWGIFDRLKNLPHVMSVNGDLRRTPCKTSLQTEIDEEDSVVQALPAPHNAYGERGEEPDNVKDDCVLSNRDLLFRLQAAAVGIWDFEELKLTQLIGEVKDKRVRVKKSTSDNSTKSKAKELSEKKISTYKKASTNSTSKAILKAASRVRNGIIVKESKAREKLAFSDTYLEKTFGLSNIAQVSEKPYVNATGKKSISDIGDRPAQKSLKAKQSTFLSSGDATKSAKKDVRSRESEYEKLPTKKKAKVSAKNIVNQRIRVLPSEKRVLPEAARAEVVAAKEEHEAAEVELTKLLNEIWGMKNVNVSDLPSDITERWIAAHAKNLRSSFNFYSSAVKHTLSYATPKVEPQ